MFKVTKSHRTHILRNFQNSKTKIVDFRLKLHFFANVKQRTCEAKAAGENSSFIFIVWVKFVPFYHLKLAYVVLHMAVKEFFEIYF